MSVVARINHMGWIHLWPSLESYESGEASVHFFNPKVDPRWRANLPPDDVLSRLEAGEIVEMEDPGYLAE